MIALAHVLVFSSSMGAPHATRTQSCKPCSSQKNPYRSAQRGSASMQEQRNGVPKAQQMGDT